MAPTTSTTTASTDGSPRASAVDSLLEAIQAGAGGTVAGLYAPDARFDATVPGWRFSLNGGAAIAAQYAGWFRYAGRFEELDRLAFPGGEVVRYLLAWSEDGVPHTAHHCHLLTLDDQSGLLTGEHVFCGGRWDAALMAAMEDAAREETRHAG